MAKKTGDMLTWEVQNSSKRPKSRNWQAQFLIAGNGPESQARRPQRLQFSTLFWHLILFVLPSYAIWQGLFMRWQAWFSLVLWGLTAIFFLFFIGAQDLSLQTGKPRQRPLQSFIQSLRQWFEQHGAALHIHKPKAGKPDYTEQSRNSVFGSYANDGKGTWGGGYDTDEDDGVSIEGYLKRRKVAKTGAGSKPAFNWNWQESQGSEEESAHILQQYHKRSNLTFGDQLQKWIQLMIKTFQQNWTQAWCKTFPVKEQKQLWQGLFCSSLLWLPLSLWALNHWQLDIGQTLQRSGFANEGSIAWPRFYMFLLFLNLTFPFLAQQVSQRLFHGLGTVQGTALASAQNWQWLLRLFQLLSELSYTLAFILLLLWFWQRSLVDGFKLDLPFASLAALAALSLYLRLSLQHKMRSSLPLFLFRQFSCLSASLGLVFYLS